MNRILIAASLSLLPLAAAPLRAEMVSDVASSFSGQGHLDDDGHADFHYWMQGGDAVLEPIFDIFSDPNTFPGGSSASYSVAFAGSMSELQASSVWSGTFTAGDLTRATDNTFQEFHSSASTPVIGIWISTTQGADPSNGMTLAGYVLDASDYYANPSSGIIDIYYHAFDNFTPGSSASVTLADTGALIPEPSTYALGAGLMVLGFVACRRRRKRMA